MIIRIVEMRFGAENVSEFWNLFESRKEKIRSFPGCHHLELLENVQDPRRLCTYSIWADELALEEYRNSDLFRGTWEATRVLFSEPARAMSLHKKIMLP